MRAGDRQSSLSARAQAGTQRIESPSQYARRSITNASLPAPTNIAAPSVVDRVDEDQSPTERKPSMILMNSPANVTSASVPSQAAVPTVTSPTGLVRPVYPANNVYVVSGGQIA